MTAASQGSSPAARPAHLREQAATGANHPRVVSVRRALSAELGCSVLFTVLVVLSTQDRAVRVHSPWQDDPYDVVVSFTQLIVPVLAAATALRWLSWTRDRSRSASRARDLLRAARVGLGAITLTLAVDWAAVTLGVHHGDWSFPGRALIAGLAALTGATLVAVCALRRAERQVTGSRQQQPAADEPDWVDDLLELALDPLGRRRSTELWLDRHARRALATLLDGRHGLRRHRVAAALLTAATASVALTLCDTVREGVGADPLQVLIHGTLVVTIGTSGLFAVLLAAGSYLRILRPATDSSPGSRTPLAVHIGLAAAVSIPLTVAFRDQLGAALGYPITSIGRLVSLMAILSAGSTLMTGGAGIVTRRHRCRH